MTHLDFWPSEGRVNLVSKTLKGPFCKKSGIKIGLNFAGFVLSRRFPVMYLDLSPPDGEFVL